MKKLKLMAVTMCSVAWILWCTLPVRAMEKDDAPTAVTLDYLEELYAAVTFDHQMHAEGFACASCHHHTTGGGSQDESCRRCHADSGAADDVSCSGCHKQGLPAKTTASDQKEKSLYHIDKPGLLGALHLQCLGCHRTEGGPSACQDCHALSPAGKKRFAVPQ